MRHSVALRMAFVWVALAVLPPSPARADEEGWGTPDLYEVDQLGGMSLEELLNLTVTVATRTSMRLAATPSVVSVITAEDLRRCGCRSLAEALRTVPGLYDIYDLVFHNVGIRGVNGGIRAGGSVVKVMIDGTAVSFAPSTANFFGPELIPIDVVDRIEIIRGPASALYGSNAFLGVINIITRTTADMPTVTLHGQGGFVRQQPAYGGGAVVARDFGRVDVLLAAEASRVDRTGLRLPPGSPLLDSADLQFAPDARSRDDLSRPLSVFGRIGIDDLGPGRLEVWTSTQRLDSVGELQDIEPMTHRTRIALAQHTVRASYVFHPFSAGGRPDSMQLRLTGAYLRSEPGRGDRINLGTPREDRLRRVRAQGGELAAELTWNPLDNLALLVVTDVRSERHHFQRFDRLILQDVADANGDVLLAAGTIVPGEAMGEGAITFTNYGVMAQMQYAMTPALSLTAGARLDVHSVYAAQVSPRAALVLAPENRPYHLKAMFGSSFKAPSAEQLYTSPVRAFDIRGNPNLDAQRARTFELAGGYELGSIGFISVNGFATQIDGRVEYVQEGLFFSAQNSLEEWYAGAEVESRITPVRGLSMQASLAWARQIHRESRVASVIVGSTEVDQPLYPQLQVHAQASYEHASYLHPRLTFRGSYVGARPASESNAALRGSVYELPAYTRLDLIFSVHEELWEGRATRLNVRVENLLDQRYVDPGFNGIDLPALGRIVMLTLTQEL